MNGHVVSCTKCNTPLPESFLNSPTLNACIGCGARVKAEIFPALFKRIEAGLWGETILVESEASCFYHPQKRASIPCEGCGRFLCALCDVELNGQHLCPACLETGRAKGKLTHLETSRVLYDSAALSTAILPLLIWPVTMMTAPVAIYFAVLSWRRPSSILPRTKIRSYLAILIAVLQIAGWIWLFGAMYVGAMKLE